jgi:plasmid stability protein
MNWLLFVCRCDEKETRMPALQVRDFPADLYEKLKVRAKHESRSLSQQTIVALREHLAAPQPRFQPQLQPQLQTAESTTRVEDGEQRLARRKALFAEMDRRPRIELPPDFPRPAEIIREIRDAR